MALLFMPMFQISKKNAKFLLRVLQILQGSETCKAIGELSETSDKTFNQVILPDSASLWYSESKFLRNSCLSYLELLQ